MGGRSAEAAGVPAEQRWLHWGRKQHPNDPFSKKLLWSSLAKLQEQERKSPKADGTQRNQRSAQVLTQAGPAETGSVQVCGQVCRNLDTIYIPENLRSNGMHLLSSQQIQSGWRAEPKKHRGEDTDRLQRRFVEHNMAGGGGWAAEISTIPTIKSTFAFFWLFVHYRFRGTCGTT